MIAQVSQLLIDLGTLAGICVAVAAFAQIPFVKRPVQYVWSRLVSGPLGSWFAGIIKETMQPDIERLHARIDAATIELRPNGGSSIKDQIGALCDDSPSHPRYAGQARSAG